MGHLRVFYYSTLVFAVLGFLTVVGAIVYTIYKALT